MATYYCYLLGYLYIVLSDELDLPSLTNTCDIGFKFYLKYVYLKIIFLDQYHLRQISKCYAPQVRPNRGSNSWPPNHDSTFPCHWDACSNHLAISDFHPEYKIHLYNKHTQLVGCKNLLFQVRFREHPQVWPNQGLNSWPWDHTTEMC